MVEINDRFARRLLGWAGALTREPSPFPGLTDPLRSIEPLGMPSDGMARAQEAWVTALDLWRNEDDAFAFLTRKHAMLEDQTPIMVAMGSNAGLQSVRGIIGRLRFGSAA